MKRPFVLSSLALAALTAAAPQGSAAGGQSLAGPKASRGAGTIRAGNLAPGERADRRPAAGSYLLRVGESQVLQFRWVTRVAVGNPAVADVAVVSDDELLLNGKAPGETNLFVWDRSGRWGRHVVVAGADGPAAPDMVQLAAAVQRDLAGLPVDVSAVGDTLFLAGDVRSAEEKARVEAVAEAHHARVKSFLRVATAPPPRRSAAEAAAALSRVFAGGPVSARVLDEGSVVLEGNVTGDAAEQARRVARTLAPDVTVVDYFQAASPRMRQVLVRTRVMEVNRQRTRDLGLDWGSVVRDENGKTTIAQPFLFGQRVVGRMFGQILPVGAALTALQQQNAARVLSEPNLLVMEGNRGSALIGGEVPIPVAQSAGVGTAVTVEYKPFGIKLDVDVLGISEEGITMRVRPEVSDLDFTQAVTANGFKLPALRTRRTESVVRIRPGESLAIGGLLQHNEAQQKRAVPLLSKIPILGELFKSRSYQKGESELVILVTPEVKENK